MAYHSMGLVSAVLCTRSGRGSGQIYDVRPHSWFKLSCAHNRSSSSAVGSTYRASVADLMWHSHTFYCRQLCVYYAVMCTCCGRGSGQTYDVRPPGSNSGVRPTPPAPASCSVSHG
eukprot:8697480-Pyramimonas_sp.AAC.1